MKISINDLPKVAYAFIRQQLIPKISDSPIQFLLGLGNNYLISSFAEQFVANIFSKYIPVLQSVGLLDDKMMLDLDLLHKNALSSLEDCPDQKVKIPIFDKKVFSLDKSDIETLYQIATRYAVEIGAQNETVSNSPS